MSGGVEYGDASWSLGTLIGLPMLTLVALIAVVGIYFGARHWRKAAGEKGYVQDDYRFEGRLLVGVFSAFLICSVIATAWGFYPYKAEYHQWRTVSGEVTDVNSRIISTGKSSVNQRFVVELDGKAFGCDDTRCASVKVGDVLTLSCKREWQYTGVDGYGCNFISNEATS